jgi:hypothetical protein
VLATAYAARHAIVALASGAAAVLVFAIGKAFLPGAPAFATLVIWICAIVGAEIAHWVSDSSSSGCVSMTVNSSISICDSQSSAGSRRCCPVMLGSWICSYSTVLKDYSTWGLTRLLDLPWEYCCC